MAILQTLCYGVSKCHFAHPTILLISAEHCGKLRHLICISLVLAILSLEIKRRIIYCWSELILSHPSRLTYNKRSCHLHNNQNNLKRSKSLIFCAWWRIVANLRQNCNGLFRPLCRVCLVLLLMFLLRFVRLTYPNRPGVRTDCTEEIRRRTYCIYATPQLLGAVN